jgi:hypothetical protein
MRLTNISDLVKSVLLRNPRARNSDKVLLAVIWASCLKEAGRDIKEMSAVELLKTYIDESILPNAESIRRVRQRLQEVEPETRGTSYMTRQKGEQEELIAELKKVK